MGDGATQDNAGGSGRGARRSVLRKGLLLVALLALAWAIWVSADRGAIAEWKSEAGPVPFFISLAVLPAIGFPTTPFFVLAGALYGVWTALIGCAIAIAANQALCYWISRSGLRPWVERAMKRTRYRVPDFAGSRAGAMRFTLLLRIAPGLPTFLKNYVLGLAGVPFWIYFWVSFLFTGLYAVSFIVLGESIFDRDYGTAGAAVGVLAVLGGAVAYYRRRNKKKLKQALGVEPAGRTGDAAG